MVIKLQSVAPERLGNYEGPGRMYRSPWEGEIINFMGGLVAGENGDGKIRWRVWGETAGIERLGGWKPSAVEAFGMCESDPHEDF